MAEVAWPLTGVMMAIIHYSYSIDNDGSGVMIFAVCVCVTCAADGKSNNDVMYCYSPSACQNIPAFIIIIIITLYLYMCLYIA